MTKPPWQLPPDHPENIRIDRWVEKEALNGRLHNIEATLKKIQERLK